MVHTVFQKIPKSIYIGKENFPSVINKELILGIFDSNDSYKEFTRGWLAEDEATVKDSILE